MHQPKEITTKIRQWKVMVVASYVCPPNQSNTIKVYGIKARDLFPTYYKQNILLNIGSRLTLDLCVWSTTIKRSKLFKFLNFCKVG